MKLKLECARIKKSFILEDAIFQTLCRREAPGQKDQPAAGGNLSKRGYALNHC